MTRRLLIFAILASATVALLLLNVFFGAVDIPAADVADILLGRNVHDDSWRFIILESRLPQAVTALLCGCSLAVCGLMLQAVFRNPLADPSILGISSGAGLGVAFVMLLYGGSVSVGMLSIGGFATVLAAAFIGATAVTLLMFSLSSIIRSDAMLLIAGVMVGYLSSSIIVLLSYYASEEGLRAYTLWGMGNFASVSTERLPLFSIIAVVCLSASVLLVKSLNILSLGTLYAENLGVNTRQLRGTVLIVTGILTALTTSFCGPVAFIGLAVPHIARMALHTDDYRKLLPATILTGGGVAMACNLACTMTPSGTMLPVNAVTPVIGAPVILYVMTRRR